MKINETRDFVAYAHCGQWYNKDKGISYIYHLDHVYDFVKDFYSENEKFDILGQVAYLHDVIEDTWITEELLYGAGFEKDVVDAVVAISKVKGESYEDYIEKVKSNEIALKVKLCDTASNLYHSIQEGNFKRINKYTKQIQLLGGFQ